MAKRCRAVLCCIVLHCAVLCCAALCCAVLRCVVLCCAALCCAVLYCAVHGICARVVVFGGQIAQKYQESMTSLLRQGVRVCAVASWLDQVVPAFSATVHGVVHAPTLLRAVYLNDLYYREDDFLMCLVKYVRSHHITSHHITHVARLLFAVYVPFSCR